jgi:seryl-tRNA synthetase
MLSISFIRQYPEAVKERLLTRNFGNPNLVDELLHTDDQYRKVKFTTENIQASINSASKEIGMLMDLNSFQLGKGYRDLILKPIFL